MATTRWHLVAAAVTTVLVAELVARALGGHIPDIDRRGHPELDHKWADLGELVDAGRAPTAVVLGNSMADGDVIPSVIDLGPGRSVYNAGFLNASLAATGRWGAMVIDRTGADTAVVVVHPLDTVEDERVSFGQTGGTIGASLDDAIDHLEPGRLDRLGARAGEVSALVRYRSTLREPTRLWDATRSLLRGDDAPPAAQIDEAAPLHEIDWPAAIDDEGWNNRFASPALQADLPVDLSPIGQLLAEEFDPTPLRELFRALDHAERTVLVIPPVADAVLDRVGVPADLLRTRTAAMTQAVADDDVTVVDLSGSDYPIDLFHDPVHLARAGAERFSRELAEVLKE